MVWRAGTRLTRGTDAVSQRTGLGQAFLGAILLGGATSLPEIATTLTAAVSGNAPMAVNNLFGGIAMQVTVLALADFVIGRRAISTTYRNSGVLLEGVLLVFVLTTATVGIIVGDGLVFGIGVWTTVVFGLVVIGLVLIHRHEEDPQWRPMEEREKRPNEAIERMREEMRGRSTRRVVLDLVVASLFVLAGGYLVVRTGEGIAEQTGLGSSFVGAVLIAIATSLPEVSTTFQAAKMGAPLMAISNIFGTNLFDAGLLFVADIAYSGPAVLNEVGRFAQVGALLGIACTIIYIAGILERGDKTVAHLGFDSLIVLILYGGGVYVLFTLR